MNFSDNDQLGCLRYGSLQECTAVQTFLRAIAVVTIQYTMTSGLHYPARLLFVQMWILAVVELSGILASKFYKPDHDDEDNTSAQPEARAKVLILLLKLAQMFCTAGALICEYQAIWHFHSLPALVMLLSIDFPLVLFGPEKWHSRLIATAGSLLGAIVICLLETNLAHRGFIMVVVSMALHGMATGITAWVVSMEAKQDTTSTEAKRGTAPESAYRLTLTSITIALCLVMIWRSESPIYTPISVSSHSAGLLLAFTTGALVLRFNYSLVAQRISSDNHSTTYTSEELIGAPVLLAALVAFAAAYTGAGSKFMVLQFVGYTCCLPGKQIVLKRCRGEEEHRQVLPSTKSQESLGQQKQPMPAYGSSTVWLTILLSFVIVTYLIPGSDTIAAGLHATYPSTATTERNTTFDFVVSRYAESADTVSHQLESILQLEVFQHRLPRAIVYDAGHTKTSTFQFDMRSLLDPRIELSVRPRENVGREGAAYLHHMQLNYDTLADQTLFMQAVPHEPRQLRQRLQDFLVDQTGFLTLSQVREYCSDCDACWDHSTWSESRDVLEEVLGRSCKGFTLTYRGQFVVSKARIRAHAQDHYQRLLHELTDQQSQKHSAAYIAQPWMPGKVDSLNSPRFGYTLERMWGAMMGCADQRLIYTCPSMESVAVNSVLSLWPISLEECQCLDEIP